VPTGNAPITETQRDINRAWYEQEEEVMRQVSDDALANNNPHASLAVAMHLSTRKAIFGDDRSEGDVVRWLTFAAEQGHPDASRMLADRYAHGRGVPQDHAMAAFWFDQGARRDDPISMTALGFLLAAGRGVAQNWPAAIRWWQRAEARAPVASRYLGDAYACGSGVDEDHTRAVAAYKRFADRDASSTIQLGYLYLRGCAPADDKAPVEAFRRAADQGYPEAQVELSALLREGRGTEVNPNEAYYWARLAERRLESGDLKHRAEGSAAAAARTMSSLEIAASDDMVKSMIAACAKPMR
jgi:TPR repeat protein